MAPEVYENYLNGQFALENSNNKADWEKGIAYFQAAIRTDPTFAPAYLGMANAYNALGAIVVGGVRPEDVRPKEVSAVRKALELDPQSADAHIALASLQQREWQWAEAESGYRLALELKPNDAGAQAGLAAWLVCQGRTNEAVERSQQARELDPLAVGGDYVSWILFLSHRYDEAINGLRVRRVLDRIVSERGLPEVTVLDNGPEFRGRALAAWSEERGVDWNLFSLRVCQDFKRFDWFLTCRKN